MKLSSFEDSGKGFWSWEEEGGELRGLEVEVEDILMGCDEMMRKC
jgi:hypothetical protein